MTEDPDLSAEAKAAAETIITANLREIRTVLERDLPDEAVFAVGLLYGNGQDELEPAAVHLGLVSDRQRLLESHGPGGEWEIMEWADDAGADLDPWPSDDGQVADATEVLVPELEAEGVDPVRWVLLRVAERLQRDLPPALDVTEDVLVVPIDPSDGDVIDEDVRHLRAARP